MNGSWELRLGDQLVGRVGRTEDGRWYAMAADDRGRLAPVVARHQAVTLVTRWRVQRAVHRELRCRTARRAGVRDLARGWRKLAT